MINKTGTAARTERRPARFRCSYVLIGKSVNNHLIYACGDQLIGMHFDRGRRQTIRIAEPVEALARDNGAAVKMRRRGGKLQEIVATEGAQGFRFRNIGGAISAQ